MAIESPKVGGFVHGQSPKDILLLLSSSVKKIALFHMVVGGGMHHGSERRHVRIARSQ